MPVAFMIAELFEKSTTRRFQLYTQQILFEIADNTNVFFISEHQSVYISFKTLSNEGNFRYDIFSRKLSFGKNSKYVGFYMFFCIIL